MSTEQEKKETSNPDSPTKATPMKNAEHKRNYSDGSNAPEDQPQQFVAKTRRSSTTSTHSASLSRESSAGSDVIIITPGDPSNLPDFNHKRYTTITLIAIACALLMIGLAYGGVFSVGATPLVIFGGGILIAAIALLHIAHRVMYKKDSSKATFGAKWLETSIIERVLVACLIGVGVFLLLLPAYLPAFGIGLSDTAIYCFNIVGSLLIALPALAHLYSISIKGESIEFSKKAASASWKVAIISSMSILLALLAIWLIQSYAAFLSYNAFWSLTVYSVIWQGSLLLLSLIAVVQLIYIIATPAKVSNAPGVTEDLNQEKKDTIATINQLAEQIKQQWQNVIDKEIDQQKLNQDIRGLNAFLQLFYSTYQLKPGEEPDVANAEEVIRDLVVRVYETDFPEEQIGEIIEIKLQPLPDSSPTLKPRSRSASEEVRPLPPLPSSQESKSDLGFINTQTDSRFATVSAPFEMRLPRGQFAMPNGTPDTMPADTGEEDKDASSAHSIPVRPLPPEPHNVTNRLAPRRLQFLAESQPEQTQATQSQALNATRLLEISPAELEAHLEATRNPSDSTSSAL